MLTKHRKYISNNKIFRNMVFEFSNSICLTWLKDLHISGCKFEIYATNYVSSRLEKCWSLKTRLKYRNNTFFCPMFKVVFFKVSEEDGWKKIEYPDRRKCFLSTRLRLSGGFQNRQNRWKTIGFSTFSKKGASGAEKTKVRFNCFD